MKAFFAVALLWLVFDDSRGDDNYCERGPPCTKVQEQINILGVFATADSNTEAVLKICTNIMSYVNCTSAFLEICEPDDHYQKELRLINLGVEICDPENPLHQDFLTNVGCFVKEMEGLMKCSYYVADHEREYKDYTNLETNLYDFFRGAECLSGYITLGCSVGQIQEGCGEGAADFFLELAQRSKQLCSPEEAEVDLKKYLDILTRNVNVPEGTPGAGKLSNEITVN